MDARYPLVIFDFDGTLADSFPFFVGAVNDLAALHGFRPVCDHEVPALRQCTPREAMRRLDFPLWKLPAVTRSFKDLMTRSIDQVPLFDGVPAMVLALAGAGVKLAVVSSNAKANVAGVLGPALSASMVHIDGGASVLGKAPRLRRMARRIGVPAGQALYIGDVCADAQAAADAGLPFAAVTWGYGSLESFRGCRLQHVFDTPARIVEVVLSSAPQAGRVQNLGSIAAER